MSKQAQAFQDMLESIYDIPHWATLYEWLDNPNLTYGGEALLAILALAED